MDNKKDHLPLVGVGTLMVYGQFGMVGVVFLWKPYIRLFLGAFRKLNKSLW